MLKILGGGTNGLMVSIRPHRLRWKAPVRVPKALESHYGTKYQYRQLSCTDKRAARLEAEAWELALRQEWAGMLGQAAPGAKVLRDIYARVRAAAEAGAFQLFGGDPDPVAAGIEWEIDRIADQHEDEREPSPETVARLAALNDARRAAERRKVPRRPEYEKPMRDLADDYLALWRTQSGLKETNTEQQKVATFDLFSLYWGTKPLRDVRRADAAAFVDALRQLDPLWGRSPKAREKPLTWANLQNTFGGQARGLSDATINRHMATLSSLWAWAQERDHCEGNNPFAGFHKKLKAGRNVQAYAAWEADELSALFNPPPKRADLQEIMLVAMFTGMRLDEIASLTVGQIRKEGGVVFVQVVDAKTPAGHRPVPLHPCLAWLAARAQPGNAARVWPGFNQEGPGKKAGADAGKEFSRFKLAKGFRDRRKVFHSFRKNVVGQLEAQSVPQSEVAQLVGHEKGFTFGRYGAGVPLSRLAEIVALIDYPGLSLPEPAAA